MHERSDEPRVRLRHLLHPDKEILVWEGEETEELVAAAYVTLKPLTLPSPIHEGRKGRTKIIDDGGNRNINSTRTIGRPTRSPPLPENQDMEARSVYLFGQDMEARSVYLFGQDMTDYRPDLVCMNQVYTCVKRFKGRNLRESWCRRQNTVGTMSNDCLTGGHPAPGTENDGENGPQV